MSIIRNFEALLGEVEDVEIIRDDRRGRIYIVAGGDTVAMRCIGDSLWFVPGFKGPDWVSIRDTITGRKAPDNETESDKTPAADEATLRLIASVPDLLAACRVCDTAITELAEAEEPTPTDWINVRAARHLARAAITKAKAGT